MSSSDCIAAAVSADSAVWVNVLPCSSVTSYSNHSLLGRAWEAKMWKIKRYSDEFTSRYSNGINQNEQSYDGAILFLCFSCEKRTLHCKSLDVLNKSFKHKVLLHIFKRNASTSAVKWFEIKRVRRETNSNLFLSLVVAAAAGCY